VYTVTSQSCNSVCLTTAKVYFSDETPPHLIVAELFEFGICSIFIPMGQFHRHCFYLQYLYTNGTVSQALFLFSTRNFISFTEVKIMIK
jgi:hypothetical protein